MITILDGDILCSLGTPSQRIQSLLNGTYKTVTREVDICGEIKHFPYYGFKEEFTPLFDPILELEKLVQNTIIKLSLDTNALKKTGLFLGSSSNDLSISVPMGDFIKGKESHVLGDKRVGNGIYAQKIIDSFGLSSISITYNTACTSSANALLDASTMLSSKIIDYAFVIGVETYAPYSFKGFTSMQLLSIDKVAPFDKDRLGMVLGESLSVIVLSRDDIAKSDWIFKGGINHNETSSVTGASLDGSGIKEVIEKTLCACNLKADDIDIIKTHGTGSSLGDLSELNGMKQVFSQTPPFFSLKPYIGHTLGSCGVSELLLLKETIDLGFIPGTPNFKTIDPNINMAPILTKQKCVKGLFLLNYFGFGGNNVSMIVEKVNNEK